MIHAYASREHYYEHLEPIWRSLPDGLRGEFFSPIASNPWGTARPLRLPADDLVLVASFVDSRKMARSRVVYVEHGAGQTYDGDPRGLGHGSYAGGDGHDHTALFLCPREEVAERWRTAYYDVPAVAVGCPKLDAYCALRTAQEQTVAFSFHWENPLCAESRSALPHYRRDLPAIVSDLRAEGWRVLGHGHPREMGALRRLWHSLDVPVVPSQDYVFRHASVFVADNTSALYEAAAIGIPTVVLNAPWYRVQVHHGLRFWNMIPGPQVNHPQELVEAIDAAGSESPAARTHRESVVAQVYAYNDGQCAQRAIDAILEVV